MCDHFDAREIQQCPVVVIEGRRLKPIEQQDGVSRAHIFRLEREERGIEKEEEGEEKRKKRDYNKTRSRSSMGTRTFNEKTKREENAFPLIPTHIRCYRKGDQMPSIITDWPGN